MSSTMTTPMTPTSAMYPREGPLGDRPPPGVRARALFAGLAAHTFLSFDRPFSSAMTLVLAAAVHAVGWPVPRGGSGAITRALVAHLEKLGGKVYSASTAGDCARARE